MKALLTFILTDINSSFNYTGRRKMEMLSFSRVLRQKSQANQPSVDGHFNANSYLFVGCPKGGRGRWPLNPPWGSLCLCFTISDLCDFTKSNSLISFLWSSSSICGTSMAFCVTVHTYIGWKPRSLITPLAFCVFFLLISGALTFPWKWNLSYRKDCFTYH